MNQKEDLREDWQPEVIKAWPVAERIRPSQRLCLRLA